jgi:hypothetical protein
MMYLFYYLFGLLSGMGLFLLITKITKHSQTNEERAKDFYYNNQRHE